MSDGAPAPEHRARCRCGAVTMVGRGAPLRTSVCHCRACQARTGSAFGAQVRFREEAITLTGETRAWSRIGDEGSICTYRFCPVCGVTCWYAVDRDPGVMAVQWGLFEDPAAFGTPATSVHEDRRWDWVRVEAGAHHD